MVTLPSDWPSLRGQRDLAAHLFGATGARRVDGWMEAQTDRIANLEFARLFSDHIDLPGVAPLDFAHRLVRHSGHALLGGIRFFGLDVARPYVEVVAHDFNDLAALCAAVMAEWRAFVPRDLRLRVLPGESLPTGARLDMSVYAGRYRALAMGPSRVQLGLFGDPEEAITLVRERFDWMERHVPELRRNVSPLDPDTLRALWADKRLHTIGAEGTGTVGLIATEPGEIDWIEGDVVMEEVVAIAHAGHGYAAAAQQALAKRAADPDRLLIGTIDGLNLASRRTADRAGRQRIMDYVFVPLDRAA